MSLRSSLPNGRHIDTNLRTQQSALWSPVKNHSACTSRIEHMGEILQIPLHWISRKHSKVSVIPNSQLAHAIPNGTLLLGSL